MRTERISLKSLIIGALLTLGLLSITMFLAASEHFRAAALESQAKTLSRVLDVAAQEVIKQLHANVLETNTSAQNLPEFRGTTRELLRGGKDAVPSERVTAVLDDPFTGGLVTQRRMDLSKVRLYNVEFELVAESGRGVTGLPAELAPALLEKAKARTGADRLKPLAHLWVSPAGPVYSVLLPVGGFRIAGYIEWVTNPVYSLRAVGAMTQLPLAIHTTSMETLYEVDNWNELKETALDVGYMLKADDGTPVLHLSVLADVEKLHADMRNTEISTVTAFAALSGAGLLLILWFFNRTLFRPVRSLMKQMERCAQGDLTTSVETQAVKELGALAHAFNVMTQRVRDSIDHERQTAEDIKGKVELILEVVENASRGDLTAQMMVFRDEDIITKLAEGIQAMLDNLNTLVAHVQRSGIHVTASTTEIAATAKQQQATIAEQAATTNQIMVTSKQISATAKELLDTMNEVTKVAEQTTDSASQGRSNLARMEQTMQQMVEASNAITAKLAVLNEKAGNINSVVTTITKVADQTNLLSLNAAIEAEKAGEYGVGFSVVATEIRRLADQTAVATWDIEQMVQEMQSAVSAGVMGMDKFSEEIRRGVGDVGQAGSQLAQIIEQVQTLLPRFDSVHEGMQSQTEGAQQISRSMVQLSESAKQTTESLRQSNNAIAQLNEAAQGLQSGISRFKVND